MLAQIFADAGLSPTTEKTILVSMISTAVLSFAASLFALIKGQMDRVQDRKDKAAAQAALQAQREQDRLDADAAAERLRKEVALQADIQQRAAVAREFRIRKDVRANTEATKEFTEKAAEAIEVSNGVKAELAESQAGVARATEAVLEVSKVIAEKAAPGAVAAMVEPTGEDGK